MHNQNYKNDILEKEITLRAAEEAAALDSVSHITSNCSESNSSSKLDSTPCAKPASNNNPIPTKQFISAHEDADDLLDVITDPHANESDWLSACDKLNKQNSRKEQQNRNARNDVKGKTRKIAIIVAIILAISGACFISSSHIENQHSQSTTSAARVDFGPYMKNLEQEIKSHWHPPNSALSKHIIVHFKVAKTGEISAVGFDRLSRDSEADAAALKSVIESMPSAPPLPPGAPDSIDICFTFDYELSKRAK